MKPHSVAVLLVLSAVAVSAFDHRPADGQTCPDPDMSTFDDRITVSPCNNDPNLPSAARFKYEGIIRDEEGDPISGSTTLGMNFYGAHLCGAAMPTAFQPDEASNENGYVYWMENLYSGYGEPGCGPMVLDVNCAFEYVIPAYDAQSDTTAGLRNVDNDRDGQVDLDDLVYFQRAFTGDLPVFRGDFSRNNEVSTADLSLWQVHFTTCGEERVLQASGDVSGVADQTSLYVHVVDRLAHGAPIPIVYPGEALNSVPDTGPAGRDVTVIILAIDYGALRGVHAHCDWPDKWIVENVDDGLLEGQVLGYPEPGIYEKSYATAFNCIVGGDPTPVGRVDIHATGPGTVNIRRSPAPRVVDCQFRELELGIGRESSMNGEQGLGDRPGLVRISSAVTTGNARFRVLGNAGSPAHATVYDVRGRAIREIEVNSLGAERILTWDGTTEGGSRAASGVYHVLVRVGPSRLVERTLLVR